MDTTILLGLLKARLGISGTVRDEYLDAIIKGILKELKDQYTIKPTADDFEIIMFVVDLASYRYMAVQKNEPSAAMPRHLQYRLHNLVVKKGGVENVQ